MEMKKSKVYVLLNSEGYITRIDGGYSIGNITDLENWVLIDEGNGDRYNLCQGNYFPQPIRTMGGAYRYKLVDGKPVECTAEEIEAQEEALKSITIYAAQICRVDERVGSLKAGKDADIVIFDGNPLEVATRAMCTLIDGEVVYADDAFKCPLPVMKKQL